MKAVGTILFVLDVNQKSNAYFSSNDEPERVLYFSRVALSAAVAVAVAAANSYLHPNK